MEWVGGFTRVDDQEKRLLLERFYYRGIYHNEALHLAFSIFEFELLAEFLD